MARIAALDTSDVRFPTSLSPHGSDAMNPDPDYSAGHVRVRTDAADRLDGHGFVFTTGRGNEVQVAAIRALAPYLADRDLDEVLDDLWRELVHDSQPRWPGSEKGIMHMAIGVAVDALRAKRAGLAEDIRRLGVARGIAPVPVATGEHMIEFVDHPHEHFLTPVEVTGGRYRAPRAPGAGAQLLDASIVECTHG